MKLEPAGKAINTAKVVRALGEEVAVAGVMPQQSADLFETTLREHEIPSFFFRIPGFVRVNVTILEREEAQTTHLAGKGWVRDAFDTEAFVDFIRQHARQGDRWALCGSVMPGCDTHLYERLITALRMQGAFAALDSSGDAFKFGILAQPAMIKPNHGELEEYFGEKIRGVRHIALCAKRFLDRGIDYIFVSLGADGMIAVHGSDCLLCSAPVVQPVDTVGCGDALVAGLLVGMQRRYSLSETCRLAVACGVSKAMHRGHGAIDAEEVMRMMEDVKVRAV